MSNNEFTAQAIGRTERDDEWDFYHDFHCENIPELPDVFTDNETEVLDNELKEIMKLNSEWFSVSNVRITNGQIDDRGDNIIRYYFDVDDDPYPPGSLEY